VIQQLGVETGKSHPASVQVKTQWSNTFSPQYDYMACTGKNFVFNFILKHISRNVCNQKCHKLCYYLSAGNLGGTQLVVVHAPLVEVLRYKPEGHGFDFRWGHWEFSLT
jgi:hypothetical protein